MTTSTTTKRIRLTAEQRAQEILHGAPNYMAASNWRDVCNSNTVFTKTWFLGREVRRVAFLLSEGKKTASRSGLVVMRHAELALQRVAKKIKSKAGWLIAEFLHLILMLGLWAARAISLVIPVPSTKRRKSDPRQTELALSSFFTI